MGRVFRRQLLFKKNAGEVYLMRLALLIQGRQQDIDHDQHGGKEHGGSSCYNMQSEETRFVKAYSRMLLVR
jgi:hypothetical protein